MPQLILHCTDVFGDYIDEPVEVMLQHLERAESKRLRAKASRPVKVDGLDDPRGHYSVRVWPQSYRAAGQVVRLAEGRARELWFPLAADPARVADVAFPAWEAIDPGARELLSRSEGVLGHESESGAALYGALLPLERAGFLNLCSKCARTRLPNGQTVLAMLSAVTELRGDRFFARVPRALREAVKQGALSGLFDEVASALHHPPAGFSRAGSWKTPDRAGNLQITFFARGADAEEEWMADLDIDDGQGFAHLFQLIRNIGGATHPYDIHQILVASQEIDPGYRFQFWT